MLPIPTTTANRLNTQQAQWALFFTRLSLSPRLFHQYPEKAVVHEPENILPPSCFLNDVTWEFDQELINTMLNHVHGECLPGQTSVPLRFCPKLITWVHTSLSTDHPGTFELLREKYWQGNRETMWPLHWTSSPTFCGIRW